MKLKALKYTGLILLALFIITNVVAYFHAGKFTRFTNDDIEKTASPGQLTFAGKAKAVFFGVNNPRPVNYRTPTGEYETFYIPGDNKLEGWKIVAKNPQGTVILFHGYGDSKSGMISRAGILRSYGYNTVLIDFRGSGGSEGNTTTIGYHEAEDVRSAYQYLAAQGEETIYLLGTSMGAVAIMKAVSDHDLHPAGIIIECPFGTMYQTVCARFHNMRLPAFPMASLFLFWGGLQNNFNAFSHKPVKYAKNIHCPTLLINGGQDITVSLEEIEAIYHNLQGEKHLQIYPSAGHADYLSGYKKEWTTDVIKFLAENKKEMEEIKLEIFADYYQFYIQDEKADGNLSDKWTQKAVNILLATTEGTIRYRHSKKHGCSCDN